VSDDLRVAPAVAYGVRERLLAVRSLGILYGLDDEGALLLAEYSKLGVFEPGEVVTRQSDVTTGVHIVLEGRLAVRSPDGELSAVGNGRGVGVIGALSRTGRGYGAVAEVRTRTLEISKDAFLAALEESFSIARNVLGVMCGMLLDSRGELPPATHSAIPMPPLEERTQPRTLVERVLELSRGGLFANANIDAVFDVARIMRQIRVPAGHVLFRAGESPRSTIRVLGGVIRCTTPEGVTADISTGTMIGGLVAMAGRKHPYDAVAVSEVIAYEIQFEDFLVILEAHPELMMSLLKDIASTLMEEA
jgi:CRP-like cAMP-binding protein